MPLSKKRVILVVPAKRKGNRSMTCSCCNPSAEQGHPCCPTCSSRGLPVSRQTLLHQVQFPDNQSLADQSYAYCADPDCPTGYFSASASTIPKQRLRAFQGGEPMLCHCFDISAATYRAALADGSAAAIKAFVVLQTKDKLCACELRNPSGRCCLADFHHMEKEYDR